MPHALLFHGPKGVGKLALAERFAGLLLCERRGPDGDPCGNCEGCRWVAAGSHPDIRFVEPESMSRYAAAEAEEGETGAAPATRKPSTEIKIDQVRGIESFLNTGSHRGGWRIALVHPAEEMNRHAADALLKALEEPAASAIFLLVSHRAARLPATIRSRCVAVPIGVPPPTDALAWLENQGAQDAARWLAYAGGAPLEAARLAADSSEFPLDRARRVIESGSPAGIEDRASLEAFAEALQKFALDRAFSAFAGRAKYGPGAPVGPAGDARAWLNFARRMGRDRALASHPLHPRLFAAALLEGIPS